MNGSLITVTPPPGTPFIGTAACGDYAGMGRVDAELARRGLIDPPSGPRDEDGHYEGVFPINRTTRLDDISLVVRDFRGPHEQNEDTGLMWQTLTGEIEEIRLFAR